MDAIIEVADLVKVYEGGIRAVDGVSFQVVEGEVFGFLGPNGAGKTTTIKILTTLLRPDGGHATIAGLDVVRDAVRLRTLFGLAGQNAAIDENLTGRENLVLVGRLYHLTKGEARVRASEILDRFELADAADRPARTYSGGMRRRLDLGASLVGRPRVLFLDEPTTGLDPRSRIALWEVIRDLTREGTTVLLTTQYLEEADALARRIAVIDRGRVIEQGTPDELKDRVGGDVIELHLARRDRVGQAASELDGLGTEEPQADAETGRLVLPIGSGSPGVLAEVVRRLDAAAIELADLALRRPTLDDVFLRLTGHVAEDEQIEAHPPRRKERRTA